MKIDQNVASSFKVGDKIKITHDFGDYRVICGMKYKTTDKDRVKTDVAIVKKIGNKLNRLYLVSEFGYGYTLVLGVMHEGVSTKIELIERK